MSFITIHGKEILKLYDEGLSPYSIAVQLDTYPNKIRRTLIKLGAVLRDKSKAQKLALETGSHTHPTKGKKRTEETKIRISEGMHQHWENMSDEEYQKRVKRSKEQWKNMSDADKSAFREAAAVAVRNAAKNGSKMEIFLKKHLQNAGYEVIFHKKGLVINSNLEIDLFVPGLKTAIEIDGPAHFFPVWGEDSLRKHVAADAVKSGLLLGAGFCVIRVKHINKNITQHHMRTTANTVEQELAKIDKKFPPKKKRFIELEIT